jgi:hypothetical protein
MAEYRRLRAHTLYLIAAAAVLVLAGCGGQPTATATPVVQPATEEPPTPTAAPTETPTPVPPTPTRTPEPATLTPTERPDTPTATRPSPTATATREPATASPPPTPVQAVIHTFEADVDVADPGDKITLTWRWSGGTRAGIYHLLPTGQLSTPNWEVGPTGSLTYTVRPERRNFDSFVLYVSDESGVLAQETVQVTLTCPDEWFFGPAPDICPADAPLVSDGAEQRFERGVMLWVAGEDRMYVLFDDGQSPEWKAYRDEWDESDPTLDPNLDPPTGLQQPVRGFGLLWREESGIRERLGWAIDEEHGYETALQRTSHYKYSDLYIRAFDGGVWKLRPNFSGWEHVETNE